VLQDGITGASHHNVATAAFPLGTVVRLYNHSAKAGLNGWSEFVYVGFVANAGVAIAAKQVLVADAVATGPYVVTNDPDSCVFATGAPQACIAISSVTTLYYGWAYCGGVVPEEYVSGMGGNYATADGTIAGPICAHDLAADAIGLGPTDGVLDEAIGFALDADAG